jgi:O-methyltransferase
MGTERRQIRARLGRLLNRGERESGTPSPSLDEALAGLSPDDAEVARLALPFTMTGVPRLQATIDAVRYCVRRGVPGAFAECGVWRGGSVLAMILTLQQMGTEDRDIYLYDTFEGMTEPTEHDTSPVAPPALSTWQDAASRDERPWGELFGSDVFDEQSVRDTVLATGYPGDRVHLVAGRVEDTLPAAAPTGLALLRLDTDWYESTLHEMNVLFPLLSPAGVLMIDDYGHWEGAKRAVDEYFEKSGTSMLLNRIDYSGRIGVKD